MKEAADGDFSIHAEENSQNEVGQLAVSYNIMAGKISGALLRMMDFTKELLKCSDRLQATESDLESISQAMKEISDGTSSQTQEVDHVVERMAELENRFGELKEKSKNQLDEAGHTMKSSEEGITGMNELEAQNHQVENYVSRSYEKIKILQEHSVKMSDIVGTINNIDRKSVV